ncbi:MAG TPA: FMN-binding protein [Tenericutes bacterium]|nr:FMN-binding protein [Mycoplasmatota bacterium]
MKKLLITLCSVVLILSVGCEKVDNTKKGNYKNGTYFGFVEYESYGKKYVTTATVYVDESGMIKSVNIDSTYFKDDVYTTKKSLGDNYGMKATSADIGAIPGGAEWYEQVSQIEEKVIDQQGLDWVKWEDEAKTKLDIDTISGVTITADTYVEAITKALKQAK